MSFADEFTHAFVLNLREERFARGARGLQTARGAQRVQRVRAGAVLAILRLCFDQIHLGYTEDDGHVVIVEQRLRGTQTHQTGQLHHQTTFAVDIADGRRTYIGTVTVVIRSEEIADPLLGHITRVIQIGARCALVAAREVVGRRSDQVIRVAGYFELHDRLGASTLEPEILQPFPGVDQRILRVKRRSVSDRIVVVVHLERHLRLEGRDGVYGDILRILRPLRGYEPLGRFDVLRDAGIGLCERAARQLCARSILHGAGNAQLRIGPVRIVILAETQCELMDHVGADEIHFAHVELQLLGILRLLLDGERSLFERVIHLQDRRVVVGPQFQNILIVGMQIPAGKETAAVARVDRFVEEIRIVLRIHQIGIGRNGGHVVVNAVAKRRNVFQVRGILSCNGGVGRDFEVACRESAHRTEHHHEIDYFFHIESSLKFRFPAIRI